MTYKNNFDNSSTGTNLEFFGCYDSTFAEDDFKNNFNAIIRKNRGAETFFYTDWTQAETPTQIGDVFRILPTVKKSELESYSWSNGTRSELVRDILDSDIKEFEEFRDILTLKKDWYFYTTRGYSQGDICNVLINKKHDIKPAAVDSLFWDCPINARLTVNGEDFYYDIDSYDWRPDEFAADVAEKIKIPVEKIRAILPDSLDYL